MNVLAIILRSALLLVTFGLVVRKAWPGELFSTPLAQLTLGALLMGIFSIAVGFVVGGALLGWLISLPPKDKRDSLWQGNWITTTLIVASVVAFPFYYESGQLKENWLFDFIYRTTTTVIGWLIS